MLTKIFPKPAQLMAGVSQFTFTSAAGSAQRSLLMVQMEVVEGTAGDTDQLDRQSEEHDEHDRHSEHSDHDQNAADLEGSKSSSAN